MEQFDAQIVWVDQHIDDIVTKLVDSEIELPSGALQRLDEDIVMAGLVAAYAEVSCLMAGSDDLQVRGTYHDIFVSEMQQRGCWTDDLPLTVLAIAIGLHLGLDNDIS